jgi:uncharacterized protein (TIGR03435 family)
LLWFAAVALAVQAPMFEVASVKHVDPPAGPHSVSLRIDHGTLHVEAAELRQIVGLAYGMQRVLVVGGPVWADADQFDIVAKTASPDATRDEIRRMLQSLLADRFHLVTRRETREILAYTLVVAKGGPKLKKSDQDGQSGLADSVSAAGVQQTEVKASPLRGLVNMLANTLGRPVVDGTGLTGNYDYTLEWGSSLPASLAQLGLKLESKKTPVDVLAIESVEKPTAN